LELNAVRASAEVGSSQEVDDNSAVNSDCNTSSLASDSENDSELMAADLLESSSESNDNEATELEMSLTETDSADTCSDDVPCDTLQTSTVMAGGPHASAVTSVDIKLAATVDIDNEDHHRHFVDSDRPFGDLKHDAHVSESILVSQLAMDIN